MSKNPAAFPLMEQGPHCNEGMSLRDWFAGQALVGLLAYPGMLHNSATGEDLAAGDHNAGVYAFAAYEVADAMLDQRERSK